MIYILTIGTTVESRRQGLASRLIRNLLKRARDDPAHRCRGVYLHVLTTNEAAIRFYESLGFTQHKRLKDYYEIGGERRDAFTYVYRVTSRHSGGLLRDSIMETYQDLCFDLSCAIS